LILSPISQTSAIPGMPIEPVLDVALTSSARTIGDANALSASNALRAMRLAAN
jgi:hypothetical protein